MDQIVLVEAGYGPRESCVAGLLAKSGSFAGTPRNLAAPSVASCDGSRFPRGARCPGVRTHYSRRGLQAA